MMLKGAARPATTQKPTIAPGTCDSTPMTLDYCGLTMTKNVACE